MNIQIEHNNDGPNGIENKSNLICRVRGVSILIPGDDVLFDIVYSSNEMFSERQDNKKKSTNELLQLSRK